MRFDTDKKLQAKIFRNCYVGLTCVKFMLAMLVLVSNIVKMAVKLSFSSGKTGLNHF